MVWHRPPPGRHALRWLLAAPLATLVVLACVEEDPAAQRKHCDPLAGTVTPADGSVDGGYEVVLDGRFIVSSYDAFAVQDTVVTVGGRDAEVVAADAVDCDPCDACIAEEATCVDCREVCDGLEAYGDERKTCYEQVRVIVPAGEPGPATVVLFNGHGATPDFTFLYLDVCEDGLDNDGDGLVDDDDPDCDGAAGDDDDSAGDDDDSAGDDDDSAGDDDDSAGDDDDSALR